MILCFPAAATATRNVYVNSQTTTSLYGFDIAQSGALGTAAGSPFSTAHNMVGIGMTPDGAHLYVSTNNNQIEAFNVAANGALSA
ncbi:MAG: hypothetical protein QOI10_3471, partial [Solirubrobacterales bacterium]|nr:hypothetical protein [Solirubrobacterales bacterium]